MQTRFSLDPSSKKHPCPACGKRRFVRYIDKATGNYLPEHFGRCDREQSCRHHANPYREGYGTDGTAWQPPTLPPPPPPSYMRRDVLERSLTDYGRNGLHQYMSTIFNPEALADIVAQYRFGTSKQWGGAAVFWQIDHTGRIRGGKIMGYTTDGHRIKEPRPLITWAHTAMKLEGFNLVQCFYGEHLLSLRPSDPVAIVESEKTAMIASGFYPRFVWIATGGKNGCKWHLPSVCKPLKGRTVTLYPDQGAFSDWEQQAKELERTLKTRFSISNLMERYGAKQGADLADYLTQFTPEQFAITGGKQPQNNEKTPAKPPKPDPPKVQPYTPTYQKGEPWAIPQFGPESYTSAPIDLDPCTRITDPRKFIEGHLRTVEAHNGNPTFLPYLERLQTLRNLTAT